MEQAVLVGMQMMGTTRREVEDSLAELARLAETVNVAATHLVVQKRSAPDPAYYIGKGKAQEIGAVAQSMNCSIIIFDDDLKPAQQKKLQELLKKKVVDRTRLILDIFAQRAHTREGKLQVELAELSYQLPRITEHFGRFEQQTGGFGAAHRGPGERKLEIDSRRIRERITTLNRQIENIRRQRGMLRIGRRESGTPAVALVGYTNAGKSTLLNALSAHAPVYADDKLFATLDPATRKVKLPSGRTVLCTDTVGFIRKLPHSLVAAFRATLEEIRTASALVHVVDCSQSDHEAQAATTIKVLKEIQADTVPMITVYNKSDIAVPGQRSYLKQKRELLVSAVTGAGIPELLAHIEQLVQPRLISHTVTVLYDAARLLTRIHDLAVVEKQKYTEKGVVLTLKSSPEHWEQIQALIRTP